MSLTKKLEAVAKQLGATFTFKGRALPLTEVFTDTGLLPGLAKRADQLAQLCLGYGLGVTFQEADESVLGNKVLFDEFTPDVLRIFMITDVLMEIVRMSPTPHAVALDELLYD